MHVDSFASVCILTSPGPFLFHITRAHNETTDRFITPPPTHDGYMNANILKWYRRRRMKGFMNMFRNANRYPQNRNPHDKPIVRRMTRISTPRMAVFSRASIVFLLFATYRIAVFSHASSVPMDASVAQVSCETSSQQCSLPC